MSKLLKKIERKRTFMLIFYAEKPASISIRTLPINPGRATGVDGRIITMSGNVADRTVGIGPAVKTPAGDKAFGSRVDIAETVFQFGDSGGHIPYATFADIAIEETAVAGRTDCEGVKPARRTIVGGRKVNLTAGGPDGCNLLAIAVYTKHAAVVHSREVNPVTCVECTHVDIGAGIVLLLSGLGSVPIAPFTSLKLIGRLTAAVAEAGRGSSPRCHKV